MLALLVIAGAYWWFHPAINIHSTDFWGFVFIVILLPLFLVFWMRSKQYKTGTKEVTKNEGKAKTFRILSFVPWWRSWPLAPLCPWRSSRAMPRSIPTC